MTAVTADRSSKWWIPLVQGILAIIIGIFFLTNPARTSVLFVGALGLWWLITGILDLVGLLRDRTAWGWKLFSGIIGIIAGIWILQGTIFTTGPLSAIGTTLAVGTAFVWVLGLLGIMYGIIGLIGAFTGGGWMSAILGVISIIFGIILLTQPVIAALGLPMVLGILLIVWGIFLLIAAFRLR